MPSAPTGPTGLEPVWLTRKELARKLRVSRETVSRFLLFKDFPEDATKLEDGRRLYHAPTIVAWRRGRLASRAMVSRGRGYFQAGEGG